MATAAPALAQPMSLTASVAVTWISDTYATDQAAREPAFPDWDALPRREDVSMGDMHHPAIVVVWRGQPGWMFQDDDPEAANTLSFSSETDFSRGPSPVPLSTVSVKQGAVRLEIAYVHATRELTLNGIPVDLRRGTMSSSSMTWTPLPSSSTRSASEARNLNGSRPSSPAQSRCLTTSGATCRCPRTPSETNGSVEGCSGPSTSAAR